MSQAHFLTQGSTMQVGEWLLNIDRQSINDGDIERELDPLSFKLLSYFIENDGRIISRKELVENIWQQSFVDDNAINRAISELRKALKSTKQPGQSIKTHYRKGYSLFLPLCPPPKESKIQPQNLKTNITPEALPAQPLTKSLQRKYSSWLFIVALILITAALWLYSEPAKTTSTSSSSKPYLMLKGETISWHKGLYANLLLPPDKSKLAYTLKNIEQKIFSDLYVMDLKNRKEYLIDSGYVAALGWSDDGERLFYYKCSDSDYSSCIHLQASHLKSGEIKKEPMQDHSIEVREVTQYNEIGDIAVFRRNKYRGITHLNALYAYDKSTGEELRITTPNIAGTGDYFLTSISNPNRIIFERHNLGQSEIYIANLDGSSLQRLATNSHKVWAATFSKKSNSLIWYNRFDSKIGSYSLDSMQLEKAVEAPIDAANYVYPLSKKSLLISTDLHDYDVGILDLKTATTNYIASADRHEQDALALKNEKIYFSTRYGQKLKHWLKTNNQYFNITDKLGTEKKIIAANSTSTQLLSYSNKQLEVLNAKDYSVIKKWKIPHQINLAAIKNNKVAIIYTNADSQNNELMLLNTENNNRVVSDIDTPISLAWFDDAQLIVNAKHKQFLILNSLTNTYSMLTTPDSITNIKPSLITMASNDTTLFLATEQEVYNVALNTMQDPKSVFKLKPYNYISNIKVNNDKLAVSFLSTSNLNSIKLYTENAPKY